MRLRMLALSMSVWAALGGVREFEFGIYRASFLRQGVFYQDHFPSTVHLQRLSTTEPVSICLVIATKCGRAGRKSLYAFPLGMHVNSPPARKNVRARLGFGLELDVFCIACIEGASVRKAPPPCA